MLLPCYPSCKKSQNMLDKKLLCETGFCQMTCNVCFAHVVLPARVDAPVPFDHQWVASGSGIPHTVSRAPASPPCHRSVPVPTQTRVPAVSLAPVGPPVTARTITSLSGISLHPASEFSDSGSSMGHDKSTGHSPGTSRPRKRTSCPLCSGCQFVRLSCGSFSGT